MVGYFSCSSVEGSGGRGGTQQIFIRGGTKQMFIRGGFAGAEVQPLTLLYTTFVQRAR